MAPPAPPLPEPDVEIDACGLLCPLPVLKARKRLMAMAPGEVLALLATDPMARIDLPHFCAEAGHALLSQDETEGRIRFLIRKEKASPRDREEA